MINSTRARDTQRDHDQRRELKTTLDRMGVSLTSSSFERVFARIREIADQSGEVSEDRLKAIVDDAVSGMEVFQGVADSYR
jgi:isopropylmalate/homocitrate/citramalate synthase